MPFNNCGPRSASASSPTPSRPFTPCAAPGGELDNSRIDLRRRSASPRAAREGHAGGVCSPNKSLSDRRHDFDQPNFGDVTAAAVVTKARLAEPIQRQFTAFRRFRRELEFQRLRRNCLRHKWVNLSGTTRHKANLATGNIARVKDAKFVTAR